MITYAARWVLPISAPAIEHGCVTVHEGRIAYVGPRAGAPASEQRDLGECVLLPGLVNAHTHLELTVMRGFLEDMPFRPWLMRLTKARTDVLDRDDLLASAIVGVSEGLAMGITTFADTCASGVAHEALRTLGARGIVYQEVFGPDPSQCRVSLAGLHENVAALRRDDSALVRTGVSPHAPYTVSDALFAATADFARAEELRLAVHIAESRDEWRMVAEGEGEFARGWRERGIEVKVRGESPIQLLERTGVLGGSALLIHCVHVNEADLGRMRDHACAVAHCPASNAKLGHGISPLTEVMRREIPVGLGSDSVASNNRMDLLGEARLAVLMQRAKAGAHASLPAASALELSTLGGARALGLAAEIGSLDVGKAADIADFSLEGWCATPHFEPATALVFALAGQPARHVLIGGREVVRDGRLLSDVTEATRRVTASGTKLNAWSKARNS
jgi:5-methylthioadenosine/S-adenosylhomocysteine deaminase